MKNVFLFSIPFLILGALALCGYIWGAEGVINFICSLFLLGACAILGAIIVDEFGD